MRDAFVRAHAYAYARVQGEITEVLRPLDPTCNKRVRISIDALPHDDDEHITSTESACDEAQR